MRTTIKRAYPWLAAIALLLAPPAVAAPVDPSLEKELLALYDSYSRAMAVGKLDGAMTLMSEQLRAQAKSQLRTEQERRDAIAMARMTTPDSISVAHSFIDKAGTKARLVTVASKAMPKGQTAPGAPTVARSGIVLGFAKEGGRWKFDEQIFGADPTDVKPCKSEAADPRSAYDSDRRMTAGGQVIRVDFKPDYTLVVFNVLGEANCAFLPTKADLVKTGVDPAALVPYAIVSLTGMPHSSDPQRMLATSVEVTPEE